MTDSQRTPAILFCSTIEAPPATLCHGCSHFQGGNDDGTARCAAFDRIPAAIYNGDVDHRAAIRGDRGVRFAAHGEYGLAIERAFTARTIRADAAPVTTETEVIEAAPENRPARRTVTNEQVDGAAPETFHVVAMVEGVPTGDRRMFESGAGSWQPLPMPFGWQQRDLPAHMEAEVVATLTRAERIGDEMHFWGNHLDTTLGHEWYDQLVQQGRCGVSAVMDDADVEIDWPEPEGDDEDDDMMMLFGEPDLVRLTMYRIRRVDQVSVPALTECFVEPVDAAAEQAEDDEAAMIASAIPTRPPASWFRPHPTTAAGLTPWTVDDNGRVYGHLAGWGTCHTSFQETCVTPPHEESMDFYATGEVVCQDGSRVPVGQITMGTGHAPLHADPRAAAAHYDHTGAAVADVAVGADEHGIWLAGALRPGTTPEQVRALRASALSGDWRKIGGALRLVAALAVNVPGFPIPRTAAHIAASGQLALVASGVVACRPCAGSRARRRGPSPLDAAAERIAATIGRGRDARVAALTARVHGSI